ncbi:MAG: hypothetical protein OQK76_05525 [Gammaproteobacteria bacterium]|nr:hypothetical protein [Gammaproteobacteria bacterium]MCW8910064.1 hypothetical protein [Gammaproteobacteria bacterium]MCW9004816.1 hypothetical protein [Gammaproteobacteria bacterium]MCW9055174.1 hypothetical protein [Gammaproteobacteria bacterium]
MNNSYNYADFIGCLTTSGNDLETGRKEKGLQQITKASPEPGDEMMDNVLFSSVLADIHYTD